MSADHHGDARMTYPFAGEIKMETIKDEDGSDKVVWARVDKDMNVTHLDMELCAKGPHNAYTALAIGVWNAALEEAARYAAGECGGAIEDAIRELKK